MASCATADLVSSAAHGCLICFTPDQADAVETYLLCRLADQGLPGGYPTSLLMEDGSELLLEDGSPILIQ